MSLSPSLLAFLRDLRVNNTREWFAENKAVYENEKKGFDAWTTELISEFADFENMDANKFVYLERVIPVECMFNQKHRKWIPVRLAKKEERVVHIEKLVLQGGLGVSERGGNYPLRDRNENSSAGRHRAKYGNRMGEKPAMNQRR